MRVLSARGEEDLPNSGELMLAAEADRTTIAEGDPVEAAVFRPPKGQAWRRALEQKYSSCKVKHSGRAGFFLKKKPISPICRTLHQLYFCNSPGLSHYVSSIVASGVADILHHVCDGGSSFHLSGCAERQSIDGCVSFRSAEGTVLSPWVGGDARPCSPSPYAGGGYPFGKGDSVH